MRKLMDSGVKWLGEIPEGWELVQLGSLFSEHKHKNIGLQSENLLSLSYGNIIRKDIATTDGLLPENFEGYNVIDDGDIVLRLTDLQNDQRSLRVGLSHERGIVTSAYVTLRKRDASLNSQFFYYLIHSYDVRKGFYGMGAGVRQGLNFTGIRKIMLTLPSSGEQRRIAIFLGEKTNQIDTLIANVQTQIEKLKSYKQSLIAEVVTRGMDPSAPMQDSGIEWLGKIPAHWKKIKHKSLFKNVSIKGHGNATVLSLYRDYGIIPKDSREDNYNVTSMDTDSYKFVLPNDLVINKMKAWSGSLAISDYEGIVSPAYYTCKINYQYVTKRFIHHYLRNKYLVGVYEMYSAGMRVGQWDLSIDDFLNIEIAIPPSLEEQELIATYLDKQCTTIDRLIDIKQRKIDRLEEYKKTLVYEYVTGKKEVQ